MGNRVTFSNENLGLNQIAIWFNFTKKGIYQIFDSNKNPDFNNTFRGLTPSQVEEWKESLISETDRNFTFTMLSSIEALFKVDYFNRVQRKDKEEISRRFREISKGSESRVRLKEDILNSWKEVFPSHQGLINKFLEIVPFRNWLAHGRYFVYKAGKKKDFQTLFPLAEEIVRRIPFNQ